MLQPKVGDRVLVETTVTSIQGDTTRITGYTVHRSKINCILPRVVKLGETIAYKGVNLKIIHLYAQGADDYAVGIKENGYPVFFNLTTVGLCAD